MPRHLFLFALASLTALNFSPGSNGADDPKEPGGNRLTTERPAVTVIRRSQKADEDLRKELLSVPETGFNQTTAGGIYKDMEEWNRKSAGGKLPNLPAELGPNQFR